ncbi:MAG: molybdopterin molybdotransferase MoeA [Verrucomicrobia bacterium]|nr:molybdopterin molybdotransferase MoeA [Verrucomicrobiota bacterium]
MISVTEADRRIRETVSEAPTIDVALADAVGEILREAIVADRPFPPFNRVAMDGVAVSWKSWQDGLRQFKLAGTQKAGDPAGTLTDATTCIEVMTGAVLPDGCDCVVPVEQLVHQNGLVGLPEELALQPWQNVHRMGLDRKTGDTLIRAGTRLLGPQLAVAATVGLHRVRIAQRPRIALVSTGDELVDVDRTPLPHQLRRSNDSAMSAALLLDGFRDIELVRLVDDEAEIKTALHDLLTRRDVIVLSGGVSAGRFDHVPGALVALGVEQIFHKISQRPGKPMWFGRGPAGQLVFGLPGNPVSATVCMQRFVLPALWQSLGAKPSTRPRVALGENITFKPELTLFKPVRIESGEQGLGAFPVPMNGSGDLAGLATSDGFVELPVGQERFEVGEMFSFWSWQG